MFFLIPAFSPRPSGTGILACIGIPATGAEAPAYFQSASPRRSGVWTLSKPFRQFDGRGRPSHIVARASPPAVGRCLRRPH